jgi:WD40 repeat protein
MPHARDNFGLDLSLWDAPTGQMLRRFEGAMPARLSADGTRMVSSGAGRTLKLWDANSGRLLRTFDGQEEAELLLWAPDARRVLSSSGNTLHIWDASTGKLQRTLKGHSARVVTIAFSAEGRHVLSGGEDGAVQLWEIAAGKLVRTFEVAPDASRIVRVSFSPDGNRVVSGRRDGTIKTWDLATGQLLSTFEGPLARNTAVAFSADWSRVLLAEWEKASLWDTATQQLVRSFQGGSRGVTLMTYSPNGSRLLSIDRARTLHIWNAASGALEQALEIPSLEEGIWVRITAASFSPDGRRVPAAGDDEVVRLWDATSGRLLQTFQLRSAEYSSSVGRVEWVGFMPDGPRLLSDGGGSLEQEKRLREAAQQALRAGQEELERPRAVPKDPSGQVSPPASNQ